MPTPRLTQLTPSIMNAAQTELYTGIVESRRKVSERLRFQTMSFRSIFRATVRTHGMDGFGSHEVRFNED